MQIKRLEGTPRSKLAEYFSALKELTGWENLFCPRGIEGG